MKARYSLSQAVGTMYGSNLLVKVDICLELVHGPCFRSGMTIPNDFFPFLSFCPFFLLFLFSPLLRLFGTENVHSLLCEGSQRRGYVCSPLQLASLRTGSFESIPFVFPSWVQEFDTHVFVELCDRYLLTANLTSGGETLGRLLVDQSYRKRSIRRVIHKEE